MTISIDQEFRDLLPPLSAEELSALEESIKSECGCREPLTLWDGIIVDGHNRYDICTRLGLKYKTVSKEFADRDSAIIWIIGTQLARRNVNDATRISLALKRAPLIAAKAKEKQVESGRNKVPQNSAEPVDTRAEVAKIAGASTDSVGKMKRVEASPVTELAGMTKAGEVSINAAAAVATLPEEEQRKAVAAGAAGVNAAAKSARKAKTDAPKTDAPKKDVAADSRADRDSVIRVGDTVIALLKGIPVSSKHRGNVLGRVASYVNAALRQIRSQTNE